MSSFSSNHANALNALSVISVSYLSDVVLSLSTAASATTLSPPHSSPSGNYAFNSNNGLHDLLDSFLDFDVYSELINHGCHCAKMHPQSQFLDYTGGQVALDDMDGLCGQYFNRKKCLTLEEGTCWGLDINNLGETYEVDVDTNSMTFSCGSPFTQFDNATNACINDLCTLDTFYMKGMSDLLELDGGAFTSSTGSDQVCASKSAAQQKDEEECDFVCKGDCPHLTTVKQCPVLAEVTLPFPTFETTTTEAPGDVYVFDTDDSLGDILDSIMDDDDYNDVINNGCHCARLHPMHKFLTYTGGSHVLNEMDKLCQDWFARTRCISLLGGACYGLDIKTVQYELYVYMNDTQSTMECIDYTNSDSQFNECVNQLCTLDSHYAKEMIDLLASGTYSQELGDEDSCEKSGDSGSGCISQCVGTSPDLDIVKQCNGDESNKRRKREVFQTYDLLSIINKQPVE
jgi:hypothetical protein